MSIIVLIAVLAIALALLMAIAWRVVIATGNAGWVDVFWSAGIGVGGAVAAIIPVADGSTSMARRLLVSALVCAWAYRLGSHIFGRARQGGNDPRYAQLRTEWGAQYKLKLLGFFEIQAVVGLVLVLSTMAAARNPTPLGPSDAVGLIIGIGALLGESLSDRQLRAFSRDPQNKGKVCDRGLWSLSRHPNYFFECVAWVAYVPISISLLGSYLLGWATLLAPLMMYWLLVHVSGIPPLEAHMLRSRPEAFRAYQARVRAFWPLPKNR